MYKKHLQQLEEERKLEEKQLEDLLNSYRKEIEAKQDEAKCKLVEAKRKLQQVRLFFSFLQYDSSNYYECAYRMC